MSAMGCKRFDLRVAVAMSGWLLACFAAATLGGIFPPGEWYASLQIRRGIHLGGCSARCGRRFTR